MVADAYDVCRWCAEPIELYNGVWWRLGTCGAICAHHDLPSNHIDHYDPAHEPGGDQPPLDDPVRLALWLDA